MSSADDLERSLGNERNQIDEFLKNYKDLTEIVPGVLRRRKELDAKCAVIEHAPHDPLEEFAPKLLGIQLFDEYQLGINLPHIPNTDQESKKFFQLSSGSASAYIDVVDETYKEYSFQGYDTGWVMPIYSVFRELSEEKTRDATLPERLNLIYPTLGDLFSLARSSVEKAKARVGNIDMAAIHMRDVIEQLWGSLAELARSKDQTKFRGIQHVKHTSEYHRDIIANCLTDNKPNYNKLVLALHKLSELHKGLSDSRLAKNPLADDIDKLLHLHNIWIITIDDISTLVNNNKFYDTPL